MATNPTYKPNEGKREEFRRYLEKTGVMDALTKVLVLLYEEADKPDDALLFIQNTLAKQTGNPTIDELKAQVVELQERIVVLEDEKMKLMNAGQDELPPEEMLPLEGDMMAEQVQPMDAPPAQEVPATEQ